MGGSSSEEDTDISESELEEYEEMSYEELKKGDRQVKTSDNAFSCPYCPQKRKRDFQYQDMLQHASGIGSGSSKKRSIRDKANHLGLAKYLKTDITVSNGAPKSTSELDPLVEHNRDEMFVFPWLGIVVNIHTEFVNGRHTGGSGSKLRDDLTARGFNPTRVKPLWNYMGHSGTALVEFNKDWSGFNNAMSFEKAYEADHHGRRDWRINSVKSGLYGWVARADDFNADNIIGENLRKIGDVRTIADIMEEEDRKNNKLVNTLANVIETKKLHIMEMEHKFQETESSLGRVFAENDKLHQSYNEEIAKLQTTAREHFQKIFGDHEKLKSQLVTQKKELELRGKELERRESRNESERKKFLDELELNVAQNSSLSLASEEQKKVDENVMRLAEEQKRQKEALHKRIIQLEKDLDQKQALQLDVEQLRGSLNVMRHMGGEGDIEVLNKAEALQKLLIEKEAELDHQTNLNQALIVKERNSNDELVEARKELINGLKDIPNSTNIGIKRMGELDSKPFFEAMKKRYKNEAEAEERASELCSLWEEYLKDPEWHPTKVIIVNGKPEEVFKEDDERLTELKNKFGNEVYEAVTTAIREINDYNPSGRYIITELWNYSEGKRASLKEGVSVLLRKWRMHVNLND